jgi:hypothetical protein
VKPNVRAVASVVVRCIVSVVSPSPEAVAIPIFVCPWSDSAVSVYVYSTASPVVPTKRRKPAFFVIVGVAVSTSAHVAGMSSSPWFLIARKVDRHRD